MSVSPGVPAAGDDELPGLPAGVPVKPAEVDPRESEAAGHVREAVVQLSRAAQRAAIYPAEHPSVRRAVAAFLDAFRTVAGPDGRLLAVVMRDRLVASAGGSAPREHRLPWLAGQLYRRGLTSLTFEGALDIEELQLFVRWMAQPGRDAAANPPVLPQGVHFTRLDFSRAQFDETAIAPGDEPPEAVAAWNALAAGVLAGWGPPIAAVDADLGPATLADAVGARIAATEGTGVSMVTRRLLQAGGELAALPDGVQEGVRKRLASFISSLPADVRRQLLAVVPDDDPAKLELLNQVLESLPTASVVELVPRVDMTPGAHAHQFLAFLAKLLTLGSHEPRVGEALETQLTRHHLPADLLHVDPTEIRGLLDTLFSQAQQLAPGDSYQAGVTALGAVEFDEPLPTDAALCAEASDPARNAAHVARIAVCVVRADPADPSTPVCLARALEGAKSELERGEIRLLADLALAIKPLNAAATDSSTLRVVHDCLAVCHEHGVAERLLASFEQMVGPVPPAEVELFRLAGLEAAMLALSRLGSAPEGPLRERLASLIAGLDTDIVRQATTQMQASGARMAPLLDVFRQIDPARAPELARLFLRGSDAALRRQALEVLTELPLASVKLDRVLVRAMEDEDPDVVRLAIRELCARHTPAGIAALRAFLSQTTRGTGIEPTQVYAVRLLDELQNPATGEVLIGALAVRRRAFHASARRVSHLMANVLEGLDDDGARTAARMWRRSAVGFWSACVGDHLEAAS